MFKYVTDMCYFIIVCFISQGEAKLCKIFHKKDVSICTPHITAALTNSSLNMGPLSIVEGEGSTSLSVELHSKRSKQKSLSPQMHGRVLPQRHTTSLMKTGCLLNTT